MTISELTRKIFFSFGRTQTVSVSARPSTRYYFAIKPRLQSEAGQGGEHNKISVYRSRVENVKRQETKDRPRPLIRIYILVAAKYANPDIKRRGWHIAPTEPSEHRKYARVYYYRLAVLPASGNRKAIGSIFFLFLNTLELRFNTGRALKRGGIQVLSDDDILSGDVFTSSCWHFAVCIEITTL